MEEMIEGMNFASCSRYPMLLILSFTKVGIISENIYVSIDLVLDIFFLYSPLKSCY